MAVLAQAEAPSRDWTLFSQTYAIPGIAILPLRLFLGLTFLYAGIQKLTDPSFLTVGAPTYIGTQLLGFSRGSPIRFLLVHFLEHAVAIGILTIVTELVIGMLVLVGLVTRLAALGGLSLNLIFFLSASWHTYPYFYGSDIVFVMAWLTLAIAGPGGFCVDITRRFRPRELLSGLGERLVLGPVAQPPASLVASESGVSPSGARADHAHWSRMLSRTEVVAGGATTLVLVLLGLWPRGKTAGGAAIASAPKATGARGTNNAGTSQASVVPPGYKKIGNVSQLPVNTAGTFTDPKSGDPAVIVHLTGSNFVAYDAVCTHAGCTVEYDPQQKLLLCPCHGAAYDPAHGATVVAGPAPTPLTELPIKIDAHGNIYL
ncbi:MAG: Rieske 2Fe-2S domain-containing protein, partial [Chloroflexota bacterium]|nr:Rieske 2Fe-2S domain-containing protein [Chloroflexota bacterium]